MKRLTFCVAVALVLAMGSVVAGADIPFAWDPNPAEENVTYYEILDYTLTPEGTLGEGESKWIGPETEATVSLEVGAHLITVRACSENENLDGSVVPICGDNSTPLSVFVPGVVTGIRVTGGAVVFTQ